MLLSTAIISARMSRMGYSVSVHKWQVSRIWRACYLGDGLVVDVDELSGLGVDL